jgi:Predicted membrane-associated Zn-dependent proteases 1
MTFIYFVLILGIVVFIHELGHYIFAKRARIYVYEFSLGMGPKIFKYNRKKKVKDKKGKITYVDDETNYCIRLFPIGGFVQMAGEEVEIDENIPEEKRFQSKTWVSRFLTIIAGVVFNFILAILILFIIGLLTEVSLNSTKIVNPNNELYPALQESDRILKIEGKKINNYDRLSLELTVQGTKTFKMQVRHSDGTIENVKITPQELKGKDITFRDVYGFKIEGEKHHSVYGAIRYAFGKFFSTLEQMFFMILYLFTGTLSLNMLSGPVGIYNVVGQAASFGFISLLSLLALISINVGFINFLPLPAFDGGRILFLIIEKIKGSPVSSKIENTIHNIAFILLMILMLYITYNDIIRFF